jgi:amino acid transporter
MSEPTLQSIGDYNGLKGEKKRVVRAVIIAGLIIGSLYVIIANSYVGQPHDALPAKDAVPALPFNH